MAHSPVRRGDDRHARDRRGHARAASRSREVRGGRCPSNTYPPLPQPNPNLLTPGQRRSDDRTRDRDRDRDHDRDRDRERDRDSYGRRDRSRDRSYDRPYDNRRRDDRRHERRDRSRDRKRSREASPVRDRRDGRDRDRYRDSRDSYDDRDRKRPRRSPSPRRDDRTHDRDRDRDRDGRTPARRSEKDRDVRAPSSLVSRGDSLTAQSRPTTANGEAAKPSAEEQAALDERQAKVAEWRAQMLAKKAAKETASPAVQSPDAAATLPAGPATNGASLKPKLDPKEIQKKVRAAKVKQEEAAKNKPLGGDVAIPTPAPANTSAPSATIPNGRSAVPSKLDTKVKGFGLNKTVGDKNEAAAPKATAGLDDDEDTERKFRKLPEFPSADLDEPEYAYEEDEDTNNINDDEEANREAALRRAEAAKESDVQDVKMVDTAIAAPDAADTDMGVDDDDDVDPLDAFMNDLDAANEALKSTRQPSRVKQEAQVFNSDDEGDLDAMGDRSDDIAAMMKKNKKKDIGAVDHAKMNYLDFRRNFYSESVEIADMDDEEVAELRAELDNITVKGKDVPKPIMKFPQGGFGTQILEVINQLQFEKPSSIQSQALPAIMSGRDTIGVAKTGSGKTMAFLLPMFRHIKDQPPLDALDGPIGMVMAPTRELAVQIHRDSKPFLKALNLRAVCAYGGAPIKDQIAEFKRGAEIVVCTPGRMIDLLAANNGRVTNLRRVSYVVLDEADRMFDMGFEPQITKILSNVRPDRQNILFSATFPPKLETLARKTLKEPVEIQVGGKSVVAAEITQMVEVREADTRFFRLLELLGQLFSDDDDTRCLIFVEKQHTADILFKELIKKGYPSVVIHGAREQIDRDQAILDFKNNVFPVMVATSVAARGLDVKQLKLVVNYDCPNHNEDYVHRCGRTGRAGNKGTAVTFVLPDQDRFANFLAKALTQSEQPVPPEVQKLADQFQEKVKSGAEKQYKRDGFGGKGIEKLDSKRQDARKDEAKRLGKEFRVDDDEDDDEPDDKKKKKDGSSKAEEESDPLPKKYADILRRAMEVQKTETPPPQSNPTPSRPAARAKGDPMAAARAAASAINNRVGGRGTARPGQPIDNHGPDAGAFHATLEINDFPQKARWAVTNRTNTSKILEEANVSITTKGRQYPQGEEPAQGDLPKLYILVEGPTSIIVEDAMADLVKKLREGVLEDLQSSGKPTTGRYKVV